MVEFIVWVVLGWIGGLIIGIVQEYKKVPQPNADSYVSRGDVLWILVGCSLLGLFLFVFSLIHLTEYVIIRVGINKKWNRFWDAPMFKPKGEKKK